MTLSIDALEIGHVRLPLDPPFFAAWDPQPRTHHTATLMRVRAGDLEGVGSGDAMLGFAGHEHLFLGHDPFAVERHVHILDWLEKPLPRHDDRNMATLRRRSRVRIAGGEGNRSFAEHRECLHHGAQRTLDRIPV